MRPLNYPEQIDLFMERQWDGIWILPCKWGRVLKECDYVCNCRIHLLITDSSTLEPFMRVGGLSLVELLVGTPWVHTSEASERPVAHRPSRGSICKRPAAYGTKDCHSPLGPLGLHVHEELLGLSKLHFSYFTYVLYTYIYTYL